MSRLVPTEAGPIMYDDVFYPHRLQNSFVQTHVPEECICAVWPAR